MGKKTPGTDFSSLRSSNSNKEHNIESECIESNTVSSKTTTIDNSLTGENEMRCIIELSDNDTWDTSMGRLPYASNDVRTIDTTQRTSNQNCLVTNKGMNFQKKGLSQIDRNICEECEMYIRGNSHERTENPKT